MMIIRWCTVQTNEYDLQANVGTVNLAIWDGVTYVIPWYKWYTPTTVVDSQAIKHRVK